MFELPPVSWLLFAGAYLAGSMAWAAHAVAPVRRGVADPLEGEGEGIDELRTPLFARGRALRLLADVAIGAAVAFVALRVAPVATGLSVTSHGYVAAFLAMVGHAWPLWRRFRGGSSAPVFLGALMVLWPWCMPAVLIVFMAVVLSTGYLAAAASLALLAVPLVAWWTDADAPRLVFAHAGAALVLLRNAPALLRTWRGEESRFSRLRLLLRLRRP